MRSSAGSSPKSSSSYRRRTSISQSTPAGKGRGKRRDHLLFAQQLCGYLTGELSFLFVIDQHRVARQDIDLGARAVTGGMLLRQLADALF